MQPSDENLILRIRQGDEHAFVELLRRYEYPIAALIRYTIVNSEDAEDVLQDTLLDAWIGLRKLREPGNARAWLMQVARNRCSDYFRSKQRREVSVENSDLEKRIDSLSHACSRHEDVIDDVVGALEQAPRAERNAAMLFYLSGFTIAEIAERHRCPEGTVKRQLFTAREFVRQALGVTSPERTSEMNIHKIASKAQPFPKTRPEIEITPLDVEPFVIDCREMRYWSIIPEIGQRSLHVDYDAACKMKRVWDLRATRKARIHKVEGVEIEVEEWWWEEGWRPITVYYYGRVLEDKVEWLAGMHKSGEGTNINTFLDESFVWAYPINQRLISEGDLFETLPDGSLKTTRDRDDFTESGAGYFSVRIGDRSFTCLRIVGLEGAITDKDTCVTEAFLADSGRMVLVRHYCLPDTVLPCNETANKDLSITIDNRIFVHFRDSLTSTGCGIELG